MWAPSGSYTLPSPICPPRRQSERWRRVASYKKILSELIEDMGFLLPTPHERVRLWQSLSKATWLVMVGRLSSNTADTEPQPSVALDRMRQRVHSS